MKKLLPFFIVLITILFYLGYTTFAKPAQYEKVDYSKWNDEAKSHFKGKSELELLRNITHLLGSEGDFAGTITQTRPSYGSDQIVIDVHEEYVPDDSIGPIDHRFIAKKKGDMIVVTEYLRKVSRK